MIFLAHGLKQIQGGEHHRVEGVSDDIISMNFPMSFAILSLQLIELVDQAAILDMR